MEISLYPVLPRIFLARCLDVFVEDLFLSFRFVSKQIENLQRSGDIFFDILITSNGASALGMF